MTLTVSDETVAAYQQDGAVLIKGLFANWVEVLREGVARNMAERSGGRRFWLFYQKKSIPNKLGRKF